MAMESYLHRNPDGSTAVWLGEIPDQTIPNWKIHASGSPWSNLQGFAPKHDHRYLGVRVEGGFVVGVIMTVPPEGQAVEAQAQAAASPKVSADLLGPVTEEAAVEAKAQTAVSEPDHTYGAMSMAELRALCNKRKLAVTGTKPVLIARLRAEG